MEANRLAQEALELKLPISYSGKSPIETSRETVSEDMQVETNEAKGPKQRSFNPIF